MSKARFWLSYDLGINGDYDGLYRWLDRQGAKECGSSMAYISNYEYEIKVLSVNFLNHQ